MHTMKSNKKGKVVEAYCILHGVQIKKVIHILEPMRAHLLDFMA